MQARLIEPLAALQGRDAVRIIVPGDDHERRFSVGEVVVQRGHEPPLHRHRHEDVLVYVVSGRATFQINDQRHEAVPGSCVLVPKGCAYGYAVASEHVHLLIILSPAGAEACLADLYGAAGATSSAAGTETGLGIDRLVTNAARHGVDVTGPPLAPERS